MMKYHKLTVVVSDRTKARLEAIVEEKNRANITVVAEELILIAAFNHFVGREDPAETSAAMKG